MKYFFLIFVLIFCLAGKNQAADSFAQIVFQQVNAYRMKQKLPPLTWSKEMASYARRHCQEMIAEDDLNHDGASERFENLHKTIPDLNTYGENVAYNHPQAHVAEDTVSRWIKSSDHYENIIGDFSHTGVAAVQDREGKIYFTQIFGKISEPLPEKTKKSSNERGITFNPPVKPR